MQEMIAILNFLEYIFLFVFVSTTVYLIKVVKKKNFKLIEKAVTNPFLPNFNLSFFSDLRNEYYKIKKSKKINVINEVSFYCTLICLLVLLVLVVLNEIIRV